MSHWGAGVLTSPFPLAAASSGKHNHGGFSVQPNLDYEWITSWLPIRQLLHRIELFTMWVCVFVDAPSLAFQVFPLSVNRCRAWSQRAWQACHRRLGDLSQGHVGTLQKASVSGTMKPATSFITNDWCQGLGRKVWRVFQSKHMTFSRHLKEWWWRREGLWE